MWKESLLRNINFEDIKRSKSKLSTVISKNALNATDRLRIQTSLSDILQSRGNLDSLSKFSEQYEINQSSAPRKHQRVRQILSNVNAFRQVSCQIQVKDIMQPKSGDLNIMRQSKFQFKDLSKMKKQMQNSQDLEYIQQDSYQGQKNSDSQQGQVQESQPIVLDNLQEKEILRIKQLQNYSCRPIKSIKEISFNKNKSSILLKRKANDKQSLQLEKYRQDRFSNLQKQENAQLDDPQYENSYIFHDPFHQQTQDVLKRQIELNKSQKSNFQQETINEEDSSFVLSNDDASRTDTSFYSQQEEIEELQEISQKDNSIIQEQVLLLFLSVIILLFLYVFWIQNRQDQEYSS